MNPSLDPALRRPLLRSDVAWLVAGIAVTFFSGMRFNVAPLGWIAAVPWLVFLRRTSGWRSRLVLLGVMQIAFGLALLKIVTPPIPWFFAPMFSVPMALGSFLAFATFEAVRSRLGDQWGIVLFPAMVVVVEWASAHTSELGSWGSSAYTQLDNLPLLQITSLFGLAGVSALLALTSAVTAVWIDVDDRRRWRRTALATAALVVAAHAYGALRMARPLPGPSVTVATVVTDAALSGGALPAPDVLAAANEVLFERTVAAAVGGARVVVWNEGATGIEATAEAAFLDRGRLIAETHGIDLLLAYVVPIDGMSRFENKYVWMTPAGPIETYLKHHPVPGEGSIVGTDPLVAHARPYGRAAGAICYDYDFPAMGQTHAALDAGLVFVPSSDWLGIDPYHTQMASIRGIEGGFSVVRAVRGAASAAYDAHGVARGLARDREGQHVLVATVPARRIPTLYSRIGDVLPLLGGGVVAAAGLACLRRRRGLPTSASRSLRR